MFFFILLLLNIFIFLKINYISKLFNIYDHPNEIRKLQKLPVPVSGGLILLINILVIQAYIYIFNQNNSLIYLNDYEFFLNLLFFLLYWLIGVVDDKIDLKAPIKIILMLTVISLYVFSTENGLVNTLYFQSGYNLDLDLINFNNFNYIFTIFCIFTLTLTLNMFDGIDGQSIILYIFILSYLYIFHSITFCLYLILPLIFMLILNLRERLYLGDNGVMLFSLIVSILIIKYNFQNSNTIFVEEILFILVLPALDLIRLVIYRIYIKKNPLSADSNHLHHILLNFITKKNYIIYSIIFYFFLIIICFTEPKFLYLLSSIVVIYISLIYKCKKNLTN